MDLKFRVQVRIKRTRHEVFEAICEPAKLSGYFTTGGSSGRLEPGKTVVWQFADYPGEVPVQVKTVVPDERIIFTWDAAADDSVAIGKLAGSAGYQTTVEITFESLPEESTLVTISESGWHETPRGLAASYENCGGWMNMASCLKAYLEYGINLREGFFK